MILDEDVGAVALLAVLVVDQGIVESIHVAGGLPDARVHEDGAVQTHDVLVHLHHSFPPVLLDIILQLHAQLTVVVDSGEAVVDLRAREDESVFLGVSHHFLEEIVLICHIFNSLFSKSNFNKTTKRRKYCAEGIKMQFWCKNDSAMVPIRHRGTPPPLRPPSVPAPTVHRLFNGFLSERSRSAVGAGRRGRSIPRITHLQQKPKG